jgi:hypothetical protein
MRVMFALLTASFLAAAVLPARAEHWCGFVDKDHARIRCGFSSIADCKQAVGEKKDGYCIPDPEFAVRDKAHVRLAASRF